MTSNETSESEHEIALPKAKISINGPSRLTRRIPTNSASLNNSLNNRSSRTISINLTDSRDPYGIS